MKHPKKYTETHEWLQPTNEGHYNYGITAYAQTQLSDVVFIELPEVGSTFSKGESLGVIESVKIASELYAPIDLEVVALNQPLIDAPETLSELQEEPFLLTVKPLNPDQINSILSEETYLTSLTS